MPIQTAPYDLEVLKNATDFTDFANGINYNLGGMFGMGILMVLFVVVYTVGLWKESDLAFASASWITFLVSILFGRIGLIPGEYVGGFAAIALVAIMLLWKQGGNKGY
jgi:hypothetical protein